MSTEKAFSTLLPLLSKTGSRLSAEDFHRTVNVVFHDIEANHYDALHTDMWNSLEQQIALVVADALAKKGNQTGSLHLLDIGCGTGLSTELLLKTALGKSIGSITLLDTSPNMLQRAAERSKNWDKEVALVNSDIAHLDAKFDVILVCSVLHHIPDLTGFLQKISALQNSGGIFIHLHDPNGDYMHDTQFANRIAEFANYKKDNRPQKSVSKRWLQPLKNVVKQLIGRKDYIGKVNDELLRRKAIKRPMTAEEIWSVTDIHVENLPFSVGAGISVEFLKQQLGSYSLANARSYGFFGVLKDELAGDFAAREEQLIQSNAMNGRNVSAAWIKN
jgi:ubiquinone/menaquinone biosynthesis C-methylase UbiE